jgi:hypothetical protein
MRRKEKLAERTRLESADEEDAMAKNEKKSAAKFRPGTHGGCEALLYEFREGAPPDGARTSSLHSRVTLIAAETFEEAVAYLRYDQPDFKVQTVTCLGLMIMVSGSPAD